MNKTWLISDTHWGHDNIIKYEDRPKDHDVIMLKNWVSMIEWNDTVIHLGDLFFGKGIQYLPQLTGNILLVRGNHDTKSNSWYRDNGITMVLDAFTLKTHGNEFVFTHAPLPNMCGFDYNIHGHLHRNTHRAFDSSEQHLLFSIEQEDYKPVELNKFIERYVKQ